jgi:pilus assembly protein CpaB
MRAKTILAVLFLASVGVAGLIFLQAMSRNMHAEAPGPEALVATVALTPGTLLRAEDVAWRPLSGTAASGEILRPDDAQRKQNPVLEEQTRAGVYGAALRVALAAGEAIRNDLIVKPGERDFLRVVLTPGERAISIPVKTGGASTGLLDPGDHVDVILTQKFDDKAEPMARRSVAETVEENLRVLAIDARATTANTAQGNNDFGRTVTLEVTPAQAQNINVAAELGKLSLTLRPAGAKIASGAQSSTPTWAGDVSPALGSVVPPPKAVVADPPTVAVMRGGKAAEMMKLR